MQKFVRCMHVKSRLMGTIHWATAYAWSTYWLFHEGKLCKVRKETKRRFFLVIYLILDMAHIRKTAAVYLWSLFILTVRNIYVTAFKFFFKRNNSVQKNFEKHTQYVFLGAGNNSDVERLKRHEQNSPWFFLSSILFESWI